LWELFGGFLMQTIDLTKDLSFAIDVVEEILNSKDGESFISSLRAYKQTKELDNSALLILREYMR
jgi:hypothetical protein